MLSNKQEKTFQIIRSTHQTCIIALCVESLEIYAAFAFVELVTMKNIKKITRLMEL
jgi:hypothetical protein